MIEGGLFFTRPEPPDLDGALAIEIRDSQGVTLAVGGLSAHPGSQMIAGDDFVSAVQFSGKLTEAGKRVMG